MGGCGAENGVQSTTDGRQDGQFVGVVQERGRSNVLAVDGDGESIPDTAVDGHSRVHRSSAENVEGILDPRTRGQIEGVTLGSEDIFENSEKEQLNSHRYKNTRLADAGLWCAGIWFVLKWALNKAWAAAGIQPSRQSARCF